MSHYEIYFGDTSKTSANLNGVFYNYILNKAFEDQINNLVKTITLEKCIIQKQLATKRFFYQALVVSHDIFQAHIWRNFWCQRKQLATKKVLQIITFFKTSFMTITLFHDIFDWNVRHNFWCQRKQFATKRFFNQSPVVSSDIF